MSTKDIKEAMVKDKVLFGIRELLKSNKSKKDKSPKIKKVFLASDARDEIKNKLENAKIDFEVLKTTKFNSSKELGLDFESEVFSILK
jgi:hypothetical protein